MKKIFMTGATGSMGSKVLNQLLQEEQFQLSLLVLNSKRDRALIRPYLSHPRVKVHFGDLRTYQDVKCGVDGAEIVLHMGGMVSPDSDPYPEMTMEVNVNGMKNVLKAIQAQEQPDRVRLVFIGTVAETGDRMPPIHWGRVGDPIKPSIQDHYAVSKVAAERLLIESGLINWAVLRQTGMFSARMAGVETGIIFHNCLDNVLEYVSDEDSAVLMRRICANAPQEFWGHVYNIGGGARCRMSFFALLSEMLRRIGIDDPSTVFDANWFALRNFHGQYYLDSDKLDEWFQFRRHDMNYFFELYEKKLGLIKTLAKVINGTHWGKRWIAAILRKRFRKAAHSAFGTMNYLETNQLDYVEPMFISKAIWAQIPDLEHFDHFSDWDQQIHIDHGYDESKPETDLALADLQQAAAFRGGKCLSPVMTRGDWRSKVVWECAFGHRFSASPRLILEAGHWCRECEEKSWNYHEIAKVNPFFAQVWYPLHAKDEPSREYPKIQLADGG